MGINMRWKHTVQVAMSCTLLWSLSLSMTSAAMVPMQQVGPHPENVADYAHVIRVGPGAEIKSVTDALASVKDASAQNRYAILVAAGTYKESRIQMKPYVDLYGGFAGEGKDRDVYQNATVLDGQKQGPIVIGSDNARLDGFVVTGGELKSHGAGILCDGVSPTIVNNIIIANHTIKPDMREGLGGQIANEGAGIALLAGSRAEVSNNLICDNSTDIGAGAGIMVRGNVQAKILRNIFCNNTAGLKDNAQFHGKEGSRSSPGASIACSDSSSPEISFNVIVMGTALYANDAGGILVEDNSTPLISFNWIAGNTAYDDGGAIYVMGDISYDEKGERHTTSPQGPVRIEDNLIAGNDAVHGGPGGVRVSKLGLADLRRNRLIGNLKGSAYGAQGGVIGVMEDNTIDDSPSFRVTGNIAGRKFDPIRNVTEFTAAKELDATDLAGAGVRIGKQWSIVKSAGNKTLVVWGKFTDNAGTFHVLDHYPALGGKQKNQKQ